MSVSLIDPFEARLEAISDHYKRTKQTHTAAQTMSYQDALDSMGRLRSHLNNVGNPLLSTSKPLTPTRLNETDEALGVYEQLFLTPRATAAMPAYF